MPKNRSTTRPPKARSQAPPGNAIPRRSASHRHTPRAAAHLILIALTILLSPPIASAVSTSTERQSTPAATGPLVIRHVELGFAGQYKLGFWTPIRITLAARQAVTGHLEVSVPDPDGVPTTVTTPPEQPLAISAGETLTETLYIKPGQRDGSLTVRFVVNQDQEPLLERTFYPDTGGGPNAFPPGLPATARLLVTVGGDVDLESALSVGEVDPAVATHVASAESIDYLPDESIGWDAVDGVVLLTSDPEPYLSDAFARRRQALANWLELGGRMYVFIGRSGEALLPPGRPLATFVPGEFRAEEPLRQPAAIEELCDSQYQLHVPPGAFQIPIAHIDEVRGRVSAYGGNMPLIIRAARGFGELVWVNFDLDIPPLADWNGRPVLMRRLIGTTVEVESNVASDAGKLTSLGYTDLVGQLRAALDVFPGVRAVPFAWVIGLTLVYLALLGPLDYLLVHRWGHRPMLTWLTLPIFALVIGGGAYGLAHASKGGTLRLNQAELVDMDLQSGLVRGNLWAHLYTPRHDRFTLNLQPRLPTPLETAPHETAAPSHQVQAALSWLGLPGRGLGGVEATADVYSIERGYAYRSDRTRLEGLPLAIWSSKSLHGRWSAGAAIPVRAELADSGDGMLVGRLSHDLDRELSGARLYYQGWVYPLGTIEPGKLVDLDQTPPPRSARNYFTRRTTLGTAAPPYDPSQRDAPRTLQMMMWYGPAGGAAYAGLLNRYQSELDLGHLLDAGRAVLVAEVPQPGSHLTREDQKITDERGLKLLVYRIVLPVGPPRNKTQ